MSEIQAQVKGKLFLYGALEPRDDLLDERLERCYRDMTSSIVRLREMEIYNHLNDKVNRSKEDHDDTNLALLYSILTEPSTASKFYHTLTLVNRDSFSFAISHTEKIIMEKMNRLQENTRIQMLWLMREVVQTGVAGADKLCFALLKQLPAGSTGSGDVYISENLMHILLDNRDWLDSQPGLISSVIYTYLSLIPCQNFTALANLREQETQMVVSLIRTRFSECCQIGRDFVRLLQAVARIPEFTELWKDILFHPQNISPQFTGLPQLLSRRTSRRFIGGRILVEVEIKLTFLLSKVKFGQHRRYQEWFQKKYLSSNESHHLIPELIRFICCVIHPTNEVLASDVIPRWALIGWLISLCQNNPLAIANARLALFYDWLSYNPESDNIMNIEPGILLMHHSLRAHPQVTASLLDFLCRMVSNFCPSHSQLAEGGVKAALRDILDKGVLLSLDPIFESPRIDDELKALVKATFPEFIQPLPTPSSEDVSSTSTEVLEIAAGGGEQEVGVVSKGSARSVTNPLVIGGDDYLQGEDSEIMAAFSDPEETEEVEERSKTEGVRVSPEPNLSSSNQLDFIPLDVDGEDSKGSGLYTESSDPWARINELPAGLGEKMRELKNESDVESRTRLMSEVLDLLQETHNNSGTDSELTINLMAPPLSDILSGEFECSILKEDDKSEGKAEEEVKPRLSDEIFRRISIPTPIESDLLFAWSIQQHQSHIGYFFLHYLHKNHLSSDDQGCFSPYRKFATGQDEDKFKNSLFNDLKECVDNEDGLFFSLLPSLCKQFTDEMVGSHEVICHIVTHVDPTQLNELVYQLLNKEFQLFGRQASNIHDILMKSLHWESFEQFCMWQLLNAESPDPNLVIPSLADINSIDHSEAISCALLFLKNESSGYSSICSLLSLPSSHTPLVEVIGGRWVSGRPTKCARIIAQFLETLEKKNNEKYPVPEANLILEHLQRIIHVLNSKQILEASESILTKTLSRQFESFPQLASSFSELNKFTSSHTQQTLVDLTVTKKDPVIGHKRSVTQPQEKQSKHEPKAKRRRVTNRDELIDT